MAQPDCMVRVTFFVGKQGNFSEQLETKEGKGDVLQGNFQENMNEGKTHEWFEIALQRYPKADYIFKCDTDIVLKLDRICDALVDINHFDDVYIGMLV